MFISKKKLHEEFRKNSDRRVTELESRVIMLEKRVERLEHLANTTSIQIPVKF